ncbi:MAG: glycerol kinase, partial [Acetobacteraceae bacterium]|nr:glycerol kinase [Acetobacteraceae bacterium]
LEATAFQVMDVVRAMEEDTGTALRALRADGGMTTNGLLMQFQADMLNVPVVRPRVIETTALGAAYAAGLAVGHWRGLDEVREHWDAARTWTPSMDAGRREALTQSWRRAVARSFGLESGAA